MNNEHDEFRPVDTLRKRVCFMKCAEQIGALVAKKNEAYGDAFSKTGDILRLLYPDGVGVSQYDDMLAVVRVLDKLFRVVTATGKDPMGELPWQDIAGYGVLMTAKGAQHEHQD